MRLQETRSYHEGHEDHEAGGFVALKEIFVSLAPFVVKSSSKLGSA
jgi:hypothetical protein